MGFSMNSGDDRGPVAEINVTPLVDVMLVLLVIFMVTAPFMENGIPIQLPKAAAKAIGKDQSPVTLTLTRDSKIYLGKDEVAFTRLIPTLQQTFRIRDRKEIFIRADGGLPYSFVAQSMAAVRAAGIEKIGLVTAPEGSP